MPLFLTSFLLQPIYSNAILSAVMPQNSSAKKNEQLSLEEYSKMKEKSAKSKLKLSFPWIIKACFIIPLLYALFLIIYYLVHLRFLPEH